MSVGQHFENILFAQITQVIKTGDRITKIKFKKPRGGFEEHHTVSKDKLKKQHIYDDLIPGQCYIILMYPVVHNYSGKEVNHWQWWKHNVIISYKHWVECFNLWEQYRNDVDFSKSPTPDLDKKVFIQGILKEIGYIDYVNKQRCLEIEQEQQETKLKMHQTIDKLFGMDHTEGEPA